MEKAIGSKAYSPSPLSALEPVILLTTAETRVMVSITLSTPHRSPSNAKIVNSKTNISVLPITPRCSNVAMSANTVQMASQNHRSSFLESSTFSRRP